MQDLLELALLAARTAMEKGAEHAEAWAVAQRMTRAKIEGKSVRSCEFKLDSGIRCHAYFKGGRGGSSAQGTTTQSARLAGEWAAESARCSDPDPDFKGFLQPSSFHEVGGLFDPEVAALDIGALSLVASQAAASALELDPSASLQGSAFTVSGSMAGASTSGIRYSKTRTDVVLSLMVSVRREGDDVGSFHDYFHAVGLKGLDHRGLARKTAARAIECLGARRPGTGRTTLVLGPHAARFLLGYVLGHGLNAEAAQRGRSCFADKLGKKIGSGALTLTDDPLIAGAVGSRGCDDEGAPAAKLVSIDKGVLMSFFHNRYTAGKAGTRTTGHAVLESYDSPLGISSSNLVPALGDTPASELISGVSDGLYIEDCMLMPNPTTGDVSASLDSAFKIVDGEIAYPIKNAMLGTNIFELLANLDAVSSDFRGDDPGTIMPTVRIRDIQVAAGR